MNIFKRIFKKSYWSSYISQIGEQTTERPTNIDYPDSYEASWIVHRCIKVISENIANSVFHLYKIRGDKIVEIEQHPFLDLIYKPNPISTGFEFLSLTQTCIEIYGNAYWYKAKSKNGKVAQLWLLKPDLVEIEIDKNGIISNYKYRVGSEVTEYTPQDIVHFKDTNPKSSLYGLSPIKPALDIISNLVFATRWNKNFFKNSARPDYLIVSKSLFDKEEKEELKGKWSSEFGGVANAHKLGFITGEIELKEMTKNIREMDFSNLTDSMITQILGAFGVGKSVIGLEGMNRAEAETQLYSFLSLTIEPKVKRLVERINEYLIIPEYGDDLYLDYDDPTPENRESIVKEYESALNSGWLSINEVRDKEGLPPIEGGWEVYKPISMVPIKDSRIGKVDEKKYFKLKEETKNSFIRNKILRGNKILKEKNKLTKEFTEIIKSFSKKSRKVKFTEQKKQELWKQHEDITIKDEKLFKTFVVRLFRDQERRFKSELTKFGKDITDIVDWGAERDLFFRLSIPVFTDIVERRGQRASELIGTTFQVNQKVINYIEDKAFLFSNYVNETTQNELRDALKDGVEQGEGVVDLTKRVGEVFESRKTWEAERIARTEVITASNGAELESYKQSGVVDKKEWLATIDDRVRDEHLALNGEVVLLSENFSNGLPYPSEPNCRCTILPVISDL